MTAWAIITGEYPEKLGGVADYTRLVARGLADAGDTVDVYSPLAKGQVALAADRGVHVHALPDQWGPRSIGRVTRALARRRPTRILVQYVAQAYGMRGVNVPFALWLAARREPIWMMFHEVAWPFVAGAPLKHHALGLVTHGMAGLLSARAERTFVSIPEWNDWLRRANPMARDGEWLPIPSTVGTLASPRSRSGVRARFEIAAGEPVIGYFGTMGFAVRGLLGPTLEALGRSAGRTLLLIGPRGEELAAELRPRVAARVIATGKLESDDVAAHIAACSLLVQPYTDGVSTRRTCVMAALVLGVPVVTNEGGNTQSIWREGGVELAADASPATIARAAETLLSDPSLAQAIAARGRALYEARFSIERTVETLRSSAPAEARAS